MNEQTTHLVPQPEAEKPKDNPIVTIAGGVEMEVSKLDGSKEKIKVRQIPFTLFQTFVAIIGDPGRSIEAYCDKPPGWSNLLTVESAVAVLEKGREINLPFFSAWSKDQATWKQSQSGAALGQLEKNVASLVAELRLRNSPAKSPGDTA